MTAVESAQEVEGPVAEGREEAMEGTPAALEDPPPSEAAVDEAAADEATVDEAEVDEAKVYAAPIAPPGGDPAPATGADPGVGEAVESTAAAAPATP